MARLGAKRGKGKNFGGLFCTESSVCTSTQQRLFDKGYARKAGLNPVYSGKISLFQSDYTAECVRAQNEKVQVLSVIADIGTIGRVARSCNRQGYHPQFLQISSTVTNAGISKPGLGDMLLSMAVFPFAGLSTPAYQEFDSAWQRYGGEADKGPAAASGWASAKLFEKAASAGDISRTGLIKALRAMRGETLGGLTAPMTFGPQGALPVKCAFTMVGNNGTWTAPDGSKPDCW